MRVEIPEFKRCCCCLPLRRGLIFWIYLKLVYEGLLLMNSIITFIVFKHGDLEFLITISSITLVVSLLEIAFCILFLVSAHRKHTYHMRIFYWYSIGILILELFDLLGCVGFAIHQSTHRSVVRIASELFLQIVLQMYLIILVRSEILKLENSVKFEFVNNTIEPECNVEIVA